MNIFLLSVTDNLITDLKNSLAKEISSRGNKVAYISSDPQGVDRPYYKSTMADYSQISADIKVDYFDLSSNFSDETLTQLPSHYGTIYLSGGNTYVFMDSARKRNIKPMLKKHLESNGLIIGASAGAIMMTPSIDLAGTEDENIPGFMDGAGFSFVDFEFHPHFKQNQGELVFLSEYRKKKNRKLYVCSDRSGLFYSEGKIKLFGDASEFME